MKTALLACILAVLAFLGCSSPVFGQVDGDIILPKIRIGEVAFYIEPDQSYEKPGLVYIYPQIEVLYAQNEYRFGLKPIFRANIEVPGHDTYRADGWNDCSGPKTCRDCRAPCKPDPIPLSWIQESNGLVKITFAPEISGYFNGQKLPLQFESDTLSFWYDILNDKRVDR